MARSPATQTEPVFRRDRLSELLDQSGLSYRALQRRIGLKKGNNVYKWVHGIQEPSLYFVTVIAREFDVSIGYLLGETDDPRPIRALLELAPVNEAEQELLRMYRQQGAASVAHALLDELSQALLKDMPDHRIAQSSS